MAAPGLGELEKKIEEALIELLSRVWERVDWRRVARGRNRMDVFQHRLKVASYENGIARVIEKLCHGLSLQSVDVPDDVIRFLRENEERAVEMLRENSVYFVIMTHNRVTGNVD